MQIRSKIFDLEHVTDETASDEEEKDTYKSKRRKSNRITEEIHSVTINDPPI
jgi:hypothetical protein